MTESNSVDPHLADNAFFPHARSPHFHRDLMQTLKRYLHYSGHLTADDKGTSAQESHEYFNLPPLDIRTAPRACYFDIDLPGLTDKSGISIHWTSSQSFVVEGDISRPRISSRDELDGEDVIEGRTDARKGRIEPSTGSVSLNGIPTHKSIGIALSKRETDKEDASIDGSTAAEPKDKYPGFSHLLRCPGSGESTETSEPKDRTATEPTKPEDDDAEVQQPTFIPDESSIATATIHHPPPMDEITLIHSRRQSAKTSSRQPRPHNDHDAKPPSTRGFSFRSNHNEHQTPLPLVSPNPFDFAAPAPASVHGQVPPCQAAYTSPDPPSYFPNGGGPPSKASSGTASYGPHHPSGDILRPVIEKGDTPQLVLAERRIGRYKRHCTLPAGVKGDQQGTEARLEAGVLTVRIPRRKDQEGLEQEGTKVVVK